MTTKFIVFSLLVASVYGSGGHSSFSYGVSDPHTGDIKDQHEKRVGDNVVGKYSLLEADGTKRIVEYQADPATGFNAIVRKEPAGGALGYGSLANSAGLGAHGALAYPGAAGSFNSAAINPHLNRLGGNPGYAPYAGANGLAGAASGPQGVPTVSHYSHSVVHDVSRPYSGQYSGAYNGGYGAAYNGGYGGYGAHGYGGQRGAAHSYNTLTRGEAFPHGYGGYGASSNGAYGAGAGAGLGNGLAW